MIHVTTTTGEAFEAETATDIVRLMIGSDRLRRRKTIASFMDAVARRCSIQTGAAIDRKDAARFLSSLANAGYILLTES